LSVGGLGVVTHLIPLLTSMMRLIGSTAAGSIQTCSWIWW